MRTTTTRRERPGSTRRPSTGRVTAPARGAARTQARMPSRGLAPRQPRGRSPLLGILSLAAFVLFWVFLLMAFNSLMVGAQNSDAKRMIASGFLGVLSFLWPITGAVLGIIGVVKANSQKVVAGIGLGLNGLLLVWILIGLARH